MCVLCGDSITHLHWTEESRHASAVGGAQEDSRNTDPQGSLRRERINRARLADTLVRFYGLKLRETPGRDYQLSDGKGRSALVGDLGELWPEAERLAGRPVDPLDPALVASLGEPSRKSGP
ncbi:hypothetical protein [Rubrobacter aplysinae]|uniref:hypothetical protein n=1 Tax=Rubrobacter aplysinae TaxID=909625 RepID=UPI00064C21C9|nr:hypothetical protein [Rubrobacter aplysinae]